MVVNDNAGGPVKRGALELIASQLLQQPIAAGRYLDEFERVDGVWRFSFRDYSQPDLMGDLRGLLLMQK
jgi:hypothetical protein